jgi:hypothetical protein
MHARMLGADTSKERSRTSPANYTRSCWRSSIHPNASKKRVWKLFWERVKNDEEAQRELAMSAVDEVKNVVDEELRKKSIEVGGRHGVHDTNQPGRKLPRPSYRPRWAEGQTRPRTMVDRAIHRAARRIAAEVAHVYDTALDHNWDPDIAIELLIVELCEQHADALAQWDRRGGEARLRLMEALREWLDTWAER